MATGEINSELLYYKALKLWGLELQAIVFAEEFGETFRALSKYIRSGKDDALKGPVLQEIADLEIMIEQLKVALNNNERMFKSFKYKKLQRLQKGIEAYEKRIKKGEINGF